MLEKYNDKELKFKNLTEEEKKSRGILGRLYGPCASTIKATRNGRYYSNELWEKVFTNPITKELLEKGGIPGELDHPTDRLETDSSKIAIMMPEAPKKDENGELIGYWDIIDTPCGRIAYALAKYGFKFGISSRGNGETEQDLDGNESVNPDTYDFSAFDLVLIPACEDARLSMVTEGLQKDNLKSYLKEELDKATPQDKKIMEQSLKDLKIDYSDSNESSNINKSAAKDTGADLVKTLQESLLAKEKADTVITQLQEKLSVCYAKEAKYEEDISNYKATIKQLSESKEKVALLQNKVKTLTEELGKKDTLIQNNKIKLEALERRNKISLSTTSTLNENLSTTETQLRKANQRVNILTEKLRMADSHYEQEKQSLTESYENLKKDYTLKQNEYTTKLSKANTLVEQYRGTAKRAVDKYIESKATALGINASEVKKKLPENYSFNDIDNICESLSDYSLQINSLPFDVSAVKKVSITESKKLPQTIIGENKFDGDEVDDSLIRLARNLSQN